MWFVFWGFVLVGSGIFRVFFIFLLVFVLCVLVCGFLVSCFVFGVCFIGQVWNGLGGTGR